MLCKRPQIYPNISKTVPLPCGYCLPCRIAKRRIWTHRMMLEAGTHEHNSFLTLTYDDVNLPQEFHHKKTGQVYADNSLNPYHIHTFINSIRKRFERSGRQPFRYYCCGEYGDKNHRPHYHLALFGVPTCVGTGPRWCGRVYVPCSCPNCLEISSVWKKGNIYLGTLTQHSAQYICGYVTKKLTSDDNDKNIRYRSEKGLLLNFRHPEFARMSRKPHGLGYDAAVEFGKKIAPFVKSIDDIPPFLVHNGRKWFLGSYLFNVVRSQTCVPEDLEGEALTRYEKTLHTLFEGKTLTLPQEKALKAGLPDVALKMLNAQRVLQIEKKQQRSKKRGL